MVTTKAVRKGDASADPLRDPHRIPEPCQQIIEIRDGGHRVHAQCAEKQAHGEGKKHRSIISGTVADTSRRRVVVELTWGDA